MKKRLIWLMVSCVLLIAALWFSPWQSPGSQAAMPVPSVPGGYYAQPFVLKLSAPAKAVIYYTTDGSLPTAASQRYAGGIEIIDRSDQPNRYRSIRNIVPDWLEYNPDTTPVEKGTVIRAIARFPDGTYSDVLTQTYFVGVPQPDCDVLCLTFSQEDVFGPDGIYVTGKAYDDWYLSGSAGPAPGFNFDENREIAANLELMQLQGDTLNQPVGLRIQGASSRQYALKNMILSARKEYGGSKLFGAPLFGGTAAHTVMLKTAMTDAMVSELVSDRSVATQESRRLRLYFNGEYWCDTFMLERYDRQYFRQHYGVDDRVLVKNGVTDDDSVDAGRDGLYGDFMDWVADTDFSDPEAYAALQQEMDIQSYIDFVAVNYYLCNWDISEGKNYIVWRSPGQGGGGYKDGRWRWCLYDMDALDNSVYNPKTPFPADVNIFTTNFSKTRLPLGQSVLFTALRQNPEFNRRFVLSFMDIVNQNMAPARVEAILARFGVDLSWNSGFFAERHRYAAEHLAKEFSLTGSLETVTVSSGNSDGGTVRVNTTVIDLFEGVWTGQYYTDYPITLTAIPADGYKFSGWKGDVNETAPTITVSPEGGISLEPVFVKTK